jgi:hypothetical protein
MTLTAGPGEPQQAKQATSPAGFDTGKIDWPAVEDQQRVEDGAVFCLPPRFNT